MDFAIEMDAGLADMTWEKAGTLFNNAYLSLAVRRGGFFQRPEFGSRLHLLKKNTARSAALAEDYSLEALQWLLDTGRATAVEVTAERDRTVDPNRMKLLVAVTQADGRVVSFDYFFEVV